MVATSLEHHLSDCRDISELRRQRNVLGDRMSCVSSCYYKLDDILLAMKKNTANTFTQFDLIKYDHFQLAKEITSLST